MDDLSKLSDSELSALAAQRQSGPRTQPPSDPSKLTDAELSAAYRAKNRTVMDQVKGAYKAIDTGVAEAAAGLTSLPNTMSRMGMEWKKKMREAMEAEFGPPPIPPPTDEKPPLAMSWPSHEEMRKEIQNRYYGGEKPYEPQNSFEKYLRTGGEFAIGGMGPGGFFARLSRVVAPTLTSEAAGQMTEGSPNEGLMRFGGAMVGGGLQGGAEALLSRPRTAEAIIRQQMPASTTPQHVEDAARLMRDAARPGGGGQLTFQEALSLVQQRPVMTDMARHLEAAPQSAPRMADFYAQRPQQAAAGV
jgi:hypothetical protein